MKTSFLKPPHSATNGVRMRSILQLGLMVLMLLGVRTHAWGKVAACSATVAWGCSPSTVPDHGGDAPPVLLASGEAAAWGLDVASAVQGQHAATPTTAGPVVVTFHGTAFLMCPGAPPPVIGFFRTTNQTWVAVGFNLYAYCRENPWSSFDAQGLFDFVASLQHLAQGNFTMAVDAMMSPVPGDARGPIGVMHAAQEQARETSAIYKTGRDIGSSHEESRNTALFHGVMKMTGGITLMQGAYGERQVVDSEGHIANKQSSTGERVLDVATGGLQLAATAVAITKAGQSLTSSSKGTVAQAEVIVEQNAPAAIKTPHPKSPTGKGSVSPGQRDPKRVWTKAEREAKLAEQEGKCKSCEKETTIDEARGHHRERHADGGKTDNANHDILCEACHKEVHRP
jgi:hypothetical protein